MDKPIIGIVPTIKNQENPYQDKSSFVNMYAEKILSSGGIPLGMLTRNVDEYLSICDGYLWPGGNKIEWSFLKILEDTIKNNNSSLDLFFLNNKVVIGAIFLAGIIILTAIKPRNRTNLSKK